MKKRLLILPLVMLTMMVVSCENQNSSQSSTSNKESTSSNIESTTSSSSTSSSSSSVPVVHTIVVQDNEDLGVTLETDVVNAIAGIDVTVTVTNSKPKLTRVNGVKVNNGATIALKGNSATFVMPDEDVVITVDAETITYSISLTDTTVGLVDLSGTPEKAQEGDVVTFTLFTKPGFTYLEEITVFSGVVETETYKTYNVSTIGEYEYSFTMPDTDVMIDVKTEKTLYSVKKGSNSSNVESWKNVNTNSSTYDLYASVGDVIEVTTKNTDDQKPVGIEVNGLEISTPTETNGNTYRFTMPARPTTINVKVTPLYRPITVNNSEHLTLTLLKKDTIDSEDVYTPITEAVARSTVYVRVEGVSEDYGINELKAKCVKTNNYSGSTYEENITLSKIEDNFYSFLVPVSNDISVTITESNLTLYRDAAFVGKYKGANIYSAGQGTDTLKNSLTILSSGTATNSAPRIDGYTITEHDETNKVIMMGKGATTYTLHYDDKSIYYPYSSGKDIADDSYFFVKDDGASIYTYKKSIFGNNNTTGKDYVVVEIYDDGEIMTGFFVDIKKSKLYMDVTFEFKTGTSISDSDASYMIKKGDKVIVEVANTGNNKYCLLDGLQGTYTGTNGDLVISGTGTATYQDKTYSYVYNSENQSLNLTLDGENISLTLDVENKTYTVLGAEGPENEYDGKSYSGVWNDDGDVYFMKVSFKKAGQANVELRFSSSTGTQAYPFSSHPNNKIDSYTVNLDGTISLTMYDGSRAVTLTLTPNADKTSFSVGSDFSNGYKTSLVTLTLDA